MKNLNEWFIIFGWLIIATSCSFPFDLRSLIIWIATFVIIISQIRIIIKEKRE